MQQGGDERTDFRADRSRQRAGASSNAANTSHSSFQAARDFSLHTKNS